MNFSGLLDRKIVVLGKKLFKSEPSIRLIQQGFFAKMTSQYNKLPKHENS